MVETFSFARLAYLVFESVLQVVIIALAGFWSASSGLLPKQSQKIISLLNVDLFTPCLIFSKLAKSLSMAKIFEIAIIPIFFGLTTGISFISGKIMSRILDLDKDETNFVVANSVFGNSNSLPVSLTLSLAYTLPNLTWDQIPNDNRDNVASRGILYLLIFQQIGQMLRWSWGYNKLMKWSGENTQHMPPSQVQSLLERTPNIDNEELVNEEQEEQELLEEENNRMNSSFLSSSSIGDKIWQKSCAVFERIRANLNPPLYSMIFAVVVAAIGPLQRELFMEDGFINNTFAEAVTQLGSVSIPLILVVLGSNLYPSAEVFPKTVHHSKLLIGSIIGRMILPSCFLLPIIAITVKYINVSILDDPIFLVVGFLLTVSPPAIQLTQITQLNEFFEAEMADILFWGYAVLSLPVSIIVVSGAIYVLQWANPT
ncbi:BFH_collapsed_G0004670.mRNA.1.CDS.1 [Saccharomyces cerevisiae]|nr:BFH_HP2_G0004510.mRNA.1.CDS.1 [Saccharomyces cerevisiae]CAI6402229.1 BFH_HP2_G0004510.mRNA.1.CDS.1 [Saccharomyces cerevisiae]CAI6405397.1 BFH_HP1_G0004580.mRNA.1.CDS.1 [Saccharomyces cerevisiae]CAI7051639.1 BFH_collapsed_G0004670.mRNA.1.CDS.1 [Saccharomyces cerevisiae]